MYTYMCVHMAYVCVYLQVQLEGEMPAKSGSKRKSCRAALCWDRSWSSAVSALESAASLHRHKLYVYAYTYMSMHVCEHVGKDNFRNITHWLDCPPPIRKPTPPLHRNPGTLD